MLSNAYFLAKIGADTAENEQHFAGNVGKIGRRVTDFAEAPREAGVGAEQAPDVRGVDRRGDGRERLGVCERNRDARLFEN